MTKYTYVRVNVHEGSRYICAINELNYFLTSDLQDLSEGDKLTITFEPIELTDEDYLKFQSFDSH